jgi:hypothetical protein
MRRTLRRLFSVFWTFNAPEEAVHLPLKTPHFRSQSFANSLPKDETGKELC